MTILPKSKAGNAAKKSAARDNTNNNTFDGQPVPGNSGSTGWGPSVVQPPAGSGWSPGGPPVAGPPSSPRWGGTSGPPVEVNSSSKKKRPASSQSQSSSVGFYGNFSDLEDCLGGPSATRRGRHLVESVDMTVGVNEPGPPQVKGEKEEVADSGCDQEGGDNEGYNSEDEYSHYGVQLTEEEWREKDRRFERLMKKKGYVIKLMGEDGNCLFCAVADQIYGDESMHDSVRDQCMNYIEQNSDYFSQYMTEDVSDYVERKRFLGVHGNHLEIQALSEMYNRPIHIYCYSEEPINIFQGIGDKSDHVNAPIRLCYHRGVHYNSLVDPHKATIGLGLGLPGYSPGSADRNLLGQAVKQSENDEVEKAMLEDKIRATDWEATNEAIQEQVARESYLQWLRDNERRNGGPARFRRSAATSSTVTSGELVVHTEGAASSPKPSCSSSSSSSSTTGSSSNKLVQQQNSPVAGCSSERDSPKPSSSRSGGGGCSSQQRQAASYINGTMFGLEDWSEDDVLTQVLAASQQEYLDNLKKKKDAGLPGSGPASPGHKGEDDVGRSDEKGA